jgi:predicted murein hydrolase (TIGR00659 family)
MLHSLLNEPIIPIILWSFITIGIYLIAKNLYRLWPSLWFMPLILTPILIAGILITLHVSYQDYFHGTQWLVVLLGPATVSFAIPIYEQRVIIRQYWPVLLMGVLAGSITALSCNWALATLVGLDKELCLSLLPRSISTPFAMEVSRGIGGIPELTALFVIITGILGAMIGDFILARISFNSPLAKGSMLGLGAHAAGTAQAHKIGPTEGAIAGLVMILVGLLNVLLLPLLSHLIK